MGQVEFYRVEIAFGSPTYLTVIFSLVYPTENNPPIQERTDGFTSAQMLAVRIFNITCPGSADQAGIWA